MMQPPVFSCGQCGHDIARWPVTNLLKQRVLDWRHVDAPPDLPPHRAVLGTPVPIAEVELSPLGQTDDVDPATRSAPPPPEVPARPALAGDLPKAAADMDKLAARNGWEVEAWFMRGPHMDAYWRLSRIRSSVVLRFLRDGHGLVAIWAEATDGSMKFDEGWSKGHHVEPLSSPQLREVLQEPRMICEACGEARRLHPSTPDGPVCHALYVTHCT